MDKFKSRKLWLAVVCVLAATVYAYLQDAPLWQLAATYGSILAPYVYGNAKEHEARAKIERGQTQRGKNNS